MNEKVRNLAMQAGAPRADYPYETVVLTVAELEKFAELLIQECMNTVSDVSTLDTNEDFRAGFQHSTKMSYYAIRDQFRVE